MKRIIAYWLWVALCLSGGMAARADVFTTVEHESVPTSHIVGALITADVVVITTTAGSVTIVNQPDAPRAVRVLMADADGTVKAGFRVTVSGKNQFGIPVTETFTRTTTGTAATTGSVAFATITGIAWDRAVGYTSTDTLKLVMSDKYGLTIPFGATGDIVKVTKSATFGAPTPQTIVTSGVNVKFATYQIPVPGTGVYDFWIRSSNLSPAAGRFSNAVSY